MAGVGLDGKDLIITCEGLVDARGPDRGLHRFLDDGVAHVMPPDDVGAGVDRQSLAGEDPEPADLEAGTRVLLREQVRTAEELAEPLE